MWAVRSQGRAVWRRMSVAVAEGRPPAREVIDGTLILLGGALLIVPGFITDAVAIVLLLPPTRALVRTILARNFSNRLVMQTFAANRRPGRAHDVDSTATDIDQPHLRP
jgi:UPF0716 protein FxsA